MKNKKLQLSLVTILFVFGLLVSTHAQDNDIDWNTFSKNLVNTISTNHEGLQQSAMRLIIQYGDKLEVNDAVFNIMRVFRFHKDPKVRQLALIALHKTGNNWAIDYLKRNLKFEKDERIKQLSLHFFNEQARTKVYAQQSDYLSLTSSDN